MRFGTIPLGQAEGAILVHSLRVEGRLFKKGRKLSKSDLEALSVGGVTQVTAVRLDPEDVPEDEAATRIARASPAARASPTTS